MNVYEKAAIIVDDEEQVQSAKLFSVDIVLDYLSKRKFQDGGLQFHL